MANPRNQHTLADVGREAGVSAMTASLVLNNPTTSSRVSDPTRRRVLAAAERLGYQPAVIPRREVPRTHTIGVTLRTHAGTISGYQMAIINGILTGASDYEQAVTTFLLPSWSVAAGRLETFCNRPIDGMILLAPNMTAPMARLLPTHLPIISIHGNLPMAGVKNLTCDDEGGAYMATNHLISFGHRRILHLTGPRDIAGLDGRVAGWRRALIEADLDHDDSLVVNCFMTYATALTSMEQWLSTIRGPLPTGFFCANDSLARGCIAALANRGLQVPRDASVVGFDDLPEVGNLKPQLTTVAQPFGQLGWRAVEHLIDICAAGEHVLTTPAPEVLGVELVVRESSGPVPNQSPQLAARTE